MLKNTTKAKLAEGGAVFGCFIRTAEPSLIEYVALLGWDFLVLDAEHGTLQPNQVEDLCRAIEPRGVTPMVRVTTNDPPTILRYLDAGAHGAHIPWVNSAAEAERAVQSVKYSPAGHPRAGRQPSVGMGSPRALERVRRCAPTARRWS